MLISVMDLFPVYDLFPNITCKYQFFPDFPTTLSKTGFSREPLCYGRNVLFLLGSMLPCFWLPLVELAWFPGSAICVN